MKGVGNYIGAVVVALIVLAATAPLLIRVAHALTPLAIAIGVVAVVVRLVFFHTRDW